MVLLLKTNMISDGESDANAIIVEEEDASHQNKINTRNSSV